jgi:hypothetical protein
MLMEGQERAIIAEEMVMMPRHAVACLLPEMEIA